jgi:hypothetical protein
MGIKAIFDGGVAAGAQVAAAGAQVATAAGGAAAAGAQAAAAKARKVATAAIAVTSATGASAAGAAGAAAGVVSRKLGISDAQEALTAAVQEASDKAFSSLAQNIRSPAEKMLQQVRDSTGDEVLSHFITAFSLFLAGYGIVYGVNIPAYFITSLLGVIMKTTPTAMTLILNSISSVAQFTTIIPGAIVVTERIAIAYIITSLLNKMKNYGLEKFNPMAVGAKTVLDNFVRIIIEYIPAVLHSVVYGLFNSLSSSGITQLSEIIHLHGPLPAARAAGGGTGGGGASAGGGGGTREVDTGGGVHGHRRRKQAGGRRSKRKHAAKKRRTQKKSKA